MIHLPQRRLWRVTLIAVLVVVALCIAGAIALAVMLPSNAELARRVAAKAGERLGVPVTVAAVEWSLLPAPHAVLRDVATQQALPVRLDRVVAWLDVGAALAGRWEAERLDVAGGTIAQMALRDWTKRPASEAVTGRRPVGRLQFTDITWITRRGLELAFAGDIVFDPNWRPHRGEVRRTGTAQPALLRLEREATEPGMPDRWRVRAEAGGGIGEGHATLATLPDGKVRLDAKIASRNVEITQLMAAFEKRSPVQARISGETTFASEAASFGELARRLRTRTEFRAAPARLLRFDLAAAIRSAGTQRAGQTPIDQLTGRLDTQNTPDGMVLRYSQVQAASGALKANGELTLFNRRIQGRATVDLVDGLVGVPVQFSGTADDPELSVSKGAIAGAAVGTALLPGIGTALGLRIGETLGRLFGDDEGGAPALPPPGKRPARPAAP